MRIQTLRTALAFGAGLALLPALLSAAPINIITPGYWLETIGPGSPGGIAGTRTNFFATTSPGAAGGTTATANFGGAPTSAPTAQPGDGWGRAQFNPSPTELGPLTVVFSNGLDSATFTGRSLVGLDPMPLAFNLLATGDPFGPLITWNLPTGPTVEIDRIQVVFYRTDTGAEVGTRVNLLSTATSYDIVGPIPEGLPITVNVRLIDQFVNSGPSNDTNILRASRAYIALAAPFRVPEPGTLALVAFGALSLAFFRRRELARRIRT